MNDSLQTRGRKLLRESIAILERDVNAALRDHDYNMVVRRAQEVVELALKGALRMLSVEYPKSHDVAPVFSEQARRKKLSVAEEVFGEIERISLWLSQARAPSFYGDRDYVREDAEAAARDAQYVVTELRKALALPESNDL